MTPTATSRPRPAKVPAALRVQMRPIDDVKPLRRNPRRGDVDRVRASIRRWGQYVPIVVRAETGEIVKGNHTHRALKEEGETHVAIVERAIATDAEAEAMAIADNVASDSATWDVGMLAEILNGGEIDVDATLLTTAEIGEIHVEADHAKAEAARTLAGERDGDPEPPVPDPPARPTTKPGDLIRLGDHLLICADASSPATVQELLSAAGAETIDLVFTSPPYNVDVRYGGEVRDTLPYDEYMALCQSVAQAWAAPLGKGRLFGWNIGVTEKSKPWRHAQMLEDLGLRFDRQLVWRKLGVPLPTWYHSRDKPHVRRFSPNITHELIYLFCNGTRPKQGPPLDAADDLAKNDVFEVAQAQATVDVPAGASKTGSSAGTTLDTRAMKAHPAVFPTRLATIYTHHLAAPGEIVADPFAGAGTLALAAERLGRRAIMAEIEPAYCDVAVARWETMTGQKADRPRRRRRKKETTP